MVISPCNSTLHAGHIDIPNAGPVSDSILSIEISFNITFCAALKYLLDSYFH